LSLAAQHGPGPEGKREKIKALKIAYITEQLQLTPEEAQVFWPVYNEFDQKRQELEIEIFGPKDKRPDIALMSDEEVDQFISRHFDKEEQMIDLREEYYKKFKEVLPVKKVFRLFEAEREFKMMLLERLQEGQRPPNDQERNPR
jgi:hypothetical protein